MTFGRDGEAIDINSIDALWNLLNYHSEEKKVNIREVTQDLFTVPYDTLYETLVDMRNQCEKMNIEKLAMPLIGCGLDRLQWDKVRDIIEDVFENTDIEILVCSL